MKTKQDLHINILGAMTPLFFAFLLVLAGCAGQDEPTMEEEDGVQLSDKEISLEVGGWKPLVESRAWLYENEDSLKDEGGINKPLKPGGNFTLHAYFDGMDDSSLDGKPYLDGARVRYNNRYSQWRFRSEDKDIDHYWPESGKLNFFAYMPYEGYTAKLHYVSGFAYTKDGGPTFTCNLPDADTGNEVEFIYAYAEGKHKEAVNLEFTHPFAVINFKLAAGSSRMTVNQLKLENIYLQGEYSHKESLWTPTEGVSTSSYTMEVNKRIPNQVNYNTIFAGPYLVMPQAFSDVELTMNLTKKKDEQQEEGEDNKTTYDVSAILNGEWKPGYKYTYSLEHGDGDSEIYFSVQVEKWTIHNYKNEVGVE